MRTNKIIKILLYDSNHIERELINEILSNIDCKVTAVASKQDCIKAVGKKKYDLIIVDQDVQETDLNDFATKISEMDPLTPIAMMVTTDSETLADTYGKLNVDFLISRPFGLRELQSLVNEAVLLSKRLSKSGPT